MWDALHMTCGMMGVRSSFRKCILRQQTKTSSFNLSLILSKGCNFDFHHFSWLEAKQTLDFRRRNQNQCCFSKLALFPKKTGFYHFCILYCNILKRGCRDVKKGIQNLWVIYILTVVVYCHITLKITHWHY